MHPIVKGLLGFGARAGEAAVKSLLDDGEKAIKKARKKLKEELSPDESGPIPIVVQAKVKERR